MSAAAQIVKDGGTIICAAECRDGIPNHGAYGQILASQPSPQALLDMITTPGYSRADQWQVQIQTMIQLKAQVMVKSDMLSDDQIRAAHLQPIHDVAESVANAMADNGTKNATLCILPNGPQT